MKRVILFIAILAAVLPTMGQNCYWVMLTDKQGTTFDPYTYFDAKAIERYQQNGADLYDLSNYPLNAGYVAQIDALATEDFGTSRWLNAVAVTATDEQTGRQLHNQLLRMGGQYFRAKGIDGRGVRIAVFDGGFPQVNTHAAFKHLRDEGRIIKTWNFPNKKENVYGWNSHGLMTLSCIAGIHRYESTVGVRQTMVIAGS